MPPEGVLLERLRAVGVALLGLALRDVRRLPRALQGCLLPAALHLAEELLTAFVLGRRLPRGERETEQGCSTGETAGRETTRWYKEVDQQTAP